MPNFFCLRKTTSQQFSDIEKTEISQIIERHQKSSHAKITKKGDLLYVGDRAYPLTKLNINPDLISKGKEIDQSQKKWHLARTVALIITVAAAIIATIFSASFSLFVAALITVGSFTTIHIIAQIIFWRALKTQSELCSIYRGDIQPKLEECISSIISKHQALINGAPRPAGPSPTPTPSERASRPPYDVSRFPWNPNIPLASEHEMKKAGDKGSYQHQFSLFLTFLKSLNWKEFSPYINGLEEANTVTNLLLSMEKFAATGNIIFLRLPLPFGKMTYLLVESVDKERAKIQFFTDGQDGENSSHVPRLVPKQKLVQTNFINALQQFELISSASPSTHPSTKIDLIGRALSCLEGSELLPSLALPTDPQNSPLMNLISYLCTKVVSSGGDILFQKLYARFFLWHLESEAAAVKTANHFANLVEKNNLLSDFKYVCSRIAWLVSKNIVTRYESTVIYETLDRLKFIKHFPVNSPTNSVNTLPKDISLTGPEIHFWKEEEESKAISFNAPDFAEKIRREGLSITTLKQVTSHFNRLKLNNPETAIKKLHGIEYLVKGWYTEYIKNSSTWGKTASQEEATEMIKELGLLASIYFEAFMNAREEAAIDAFLLAGLVFILQSRVMSFLSRKPISALMGCVCFPKHQDRSLILTHPLWLEIQKHFVVLTGTGATPDDSCFPFFVNLNSQEHLTLNVSGTIPLSNYFKSFSATAEEEKEEKEVAENIQDSNLRMARDLMQGTSKRSPEWVKSMVDVLIYMRASFAQPSRTIRSSQKFEFTEEICDIDIKIKGEHLVDSRSCFTIDGFTVLHHIREHEHPTKELSNEFLGSIPRSAISAVSRFLVNPHIDWHAKVEAAIKYIKANHIILENKDFKILFQRLLYSLVEPSSSEKDSAIAKQLAVFVQEESKICIERVDYGSCCYLLEWNDHCKQLFPAVKSEFTSSVEELRGLLKLLASQNKNFFQLPKEKRQLFYLNRALLYSQLIIEIGRQREISLQDAIDLMMGQIWLTSLENTNATQAYDSPIVNLERHYLYEFAKHHRVKQSSMKWASDLNRILSSFEEEARRKITSQVGEQLCALLGLPSLITRIEHSSGSFKIILEKEGRDLYSFKWSQGLIDDENGCTTLLPYKLIRDETVINLFPFVVLATIRKDNNSEKFYCFFDHDDVPSIIGMKQGTLVINQIMGRRLCLCKNSFTANRSNAWLTNCTIWFDGDSIVFFRNKKGVVQYAALLEKATEHDSMRRMDKIWKNRDILWESERKEHQDLTEPRRLSDWYRFCKPNLWIDESLKVSEIDFSSLDLHFRRDSSGGFESIEYPGYSLAEPDPISFSSIFGSFSFYLILKTKTGQHKFIIPTGSHPRYYCYDLNDLGIFSDTHTGNLFLASCLIKGGNPEGDFYLKAYGPPPKGTDRLGDTEEFILFGIWDALHESSTMDRNDLSLQLYVGYLLLRYTNSGSGFVTDLKKKYKEYTKLNEMERMSLRPILDEVHVVYLFEQFSKMTEEPASDLNAKPVRSMVLEVSLPKLPPWEPYKSSSFCPQALTGYQRLKETELKEGAIDSAIKNWIASVAREAEEGIQIWQKQISSIYANLINSFKGEKERKEKAESGQFLELANIRYPCSIKSLMHFFVKGINKLAIGQDVTAGQIETWQVSIGHGIFAEIRLQTLKKIKAICARESSTREALENIKNELLPLLERRTVTPTPVAADENEAVISASNRRAVVMELLELNDDPASAFRLFDLGT